MKRISIEQVRKYLLGAIVALWAGFGLFLGATAHAAIVGQPFGGRISHFTNPEGFVSARQNFDDVDVAAWPGELSTVTVWLRRNADVSACAGQDITAIVRWGSGLNALASNESYNLTGSFLPYTFSFTGVRPDLDELEALVIAGSDVLGCVDDAELDIQAGMNDELGEVGSFEVGDSPYDMRVVFTTIETYPTISNVREYPFASGASISWTTDEPSDSHIFWGIEDTYTDEPSGESYASADVLEHSRTVTGMPSGTVVHYKLCSTDAYGQQTCTGDLTFMTTSEGAGTLPSEVHSQMLVPPQLAFGEAVLAYVKASRLNATGSCPPGDPPQDGSCLWYWSMLTDIPKTVPSVTDASAVDWYIMSAGGTEICHDTESLNAGNDAYDGSIFSPIFSGCPDFVEGVKYRYKVRARYGVSMDYGPFAYGTLQAVADDFTPPGGYSQDDTDSYWYVSSTEADTATPECTFSGTFWEFPGEIFDCANAYFLWLVVPPPASAFYADVVTVKDAFIDLWPVYYLFDFYDEAQLASAADCPLPSVLGGTFLGYSMPTFGFCEPLENVGDQIEGSLIETLFIAALWLGVLVICLRAVSRVVPFIHHQ